MKLRQYEMGFIYHDLMASTSVIGPWTKISAPNERQAILRFRDGIGETDGIVIRKGNKMKVISPYEAHEM